MNKHEQEGWKELNQILRCAVSTAKRHPDMTNFLNELNNCLPSLVGRGFIQPDVMHKVYMELKECQKAMGKETPDLKDLI